MADGSPSTPLKRRPSYRALGDLSATHAGAGAAVWFLCVPQEESVVDEPTGGHFLEACALCRLPLWHNQDIYMCRGNVPFCSEECRQEWMEVDEMPMREEGEEKRAYYRCISAKAAGAASTPTEQAGVKAASRIFHVRAAETVVAS